MKLTPKVKVSLQYDDIAHLYLVDGEPRRSVSEVCDEVDGAMDVEFIAERYRERGTNAARMIQLEEQGILDEASVHEELAPFLAAFRLFKREARWKTVAVEVFVYSPRLRTTGRIDLLGVLPDTPRRSVLVNDIKLGSHLARYELQTAGYASLTRDYFSIRTVGRLATHLQKDGKYKVRVHERAADVLAFEGACHALNWKEAFGGR